MRGSLSARQAAPSHGLLCELAGYLTEMFHCNVGCASSSAPMLDFINYLWAVKLAVEIGIQMVSLVGHQGAEWPIGRRDTAIA